jgi:hypothetical protein
MLEVIQFSDDGIYLSPFRDTIVKTGFFLLRAIEGSQGWKGGELRERPLKASHRKGYLTQGLAM